MKLPAKLYKYEPFSTQSLENLKAQAIYFGSPLGFNNPYDCATNPVVLKPSAQEAESARQHYLSDKTTPQEAKLKFEQMPVNDLQEMLYRIGTEAISSNVERFGKERGVSCFSEINDDLLMWGHYGGKYKGFCLEFSTEHNPFSQAHQVKYVDRVPEASVIPFLTGSELELDNAAKDLYLIKSKSWYYEKEWRIVHKDVGTRYHYEPNALTGVYFGPEIPNEALEIIALILRGQNPHVKLFRGERSKSEFKVDFTEIGYLTHLEAKNRGLR
ncbi:hypothetical protein Cpar_0023 [Chlorobaculum parvum NCIB 8327]|uniref:DUF2971 domain-containing protein n=2 Tax=Chlorobaculum parvum TaxID=274539 RepID=B3QRE7_CHLP8|nr:hypothetical protein Cpar_0023 [Chlorobaculum parvum NCIB 8327]